VTTKGLADPVAVLLVAPVAAHVAVKLAAVPPLDDAVKATEICPAPAVATTLVGAPGAVVLVAAGVTELLLEEAALVPMELVAVTEQV
jgi:hypothetical protein